VDITPLVWIITIAVTIAFFIYEFFAHVRKPHEPSIGESARWSAFYIGLALIFGVVIGMVWGWDFGGEYYAGYLTEACRRLRPKASRLTLRIGATRWHRTGQEPGHTASAAETARAPKPQFLQTVKGRGLGQAEARGGGKRRTSVRGGTPSQPEAGPDAGASAGDKSLARSAARQGSKRLDIGRQPHTSRLTSTSRSPPTSVCSPAHSTPNVPSRLPCTSPGKA
jgi:hypothetical protein